MSSSADSSSSTLRTLALILLPVLGIVLVVVAIFATRAKEKSTVAVVVTEGQAGLDVNVGTIIDATDGNASLLPQLGYRYKVFVDDESDDRSSGIAKIGRLVTFIPGARRGQTAIIDVTRVRERVADAILVKVLSEVALPPKAPRPAFVPQPGDSAGHVLPGAEMDVVISEASEKNPTTEGVAKVAGLVVFVNGATTVGERVNVRITDRRERMAFAELTGKPAGTEPLPAETAPRPPRATFVPPAGDPVVIGAEMDLVIAEPSDKNPGAEGIARVGGLVVAVKGAATIGERVNVRIVERRDRIAFAELTGKPAGTGPLPEIAAPARAPRAAFVPPAGDPVVVGAEMDVVVSEASEKNPTTEGVARIGGLVVFVNGATTIGERVNVRIVERRERVAMAMPTGKPAGTGPLPEIAAPARPPRSPRPAYVPGPGDSAPHVVPGAVVALTIVEPSDKNPTTEGVAKIDGFVVFVKGATVPGQAVNVRITDRRRSLAMGEVTTDPVTAAPASVMPVETTPVAAPAAAPAVEAIPEPAVEVPVAEPVPAVVPATAPVVAPAPVVVPAAPAPVVAPVAEPAPAPVAAPAAP